MSTCVFCDLHAERVLASNKFAIAVRDGFPVSPGHTLIISKRHLASFFETTKEERLAIFQLMDEVKHGIESEFHPASYNIGVNDGPEAGQTIPHLHIHLIPRYPGDDADPRGGVRRIFPKKANYWTA